MSKSGFAAVRCSEFLDLPVTTNLGHHAAWLVYIYQRRVKVSPPNTQFSSRIPPRGIKLQDRYAYIRHALSREERSSRAVVKWQKAFEGNFGIVPNVNSRKILQSRPSGPATTHLGHRTAWALHT